MAQGGIHLKNQARPTYHQILKRFLAAKSFDLARSKVKPTKPHMDVLSG